MIDDKYIYVFSLVVRVIRHLFSLMVTGHRYPLMLIGYGFPLMVLRRNRETVVRLATEHVGLA